jgi:hypothetical protein
MQILRTDNLPFTVRVVATEDDLRQSVNVRHQAYARHVPSLAASLRIPEAADLTPGSVVLLAQSKLDGVALGTIRIQTNDRGPLALESSLSLPERFTGKRLAEATRLGVVSDRVGRLAKLALFKAFYRYCVEDKIDAMVIAARSPLDRQYESFLFQDVLPGGAFVPMQHAAGIPHRVLSLSVDVAEKIWRYGGHPHYDFFVTTHHPDIDLSGCKHAVKSLRQQLDIGQTYVAA